MTPWKGLVAANTLVCFASNHQSVAGRPGEGLGVRSILPGEPLRTPETAH
jgi:hypothetical protein